MNMGKAPGDDQTRPFFTDVSALRERARGHMLDGAVTKGYDGDTEIADYDGSGSLIPVVAPAGQRNIAAGLSGLVREVALTTMSPALSIFASPG